jgi:DNA-binding MarR family transcriptional regulator
MKPRTEDFEKALTGLQHILIARRVLASDENIRLNWSHFNIMALVGETPLTPSQISTALQLSRSSTSKHLKYLEENNLIEKVQASEDKRSHTVQATKTAKNIIGNIVKGQEQNAAIARRVLSAQQADMFVIAANKIIAALDSESLKTI